MSSECDIINYKRNFYRLCLCYSINDIKFTIKTRIFRTFTYYLFLLKLTLCRFRFLTGLI